MKPIKPSLIALVLTFFLVAGQHVVPANVPVETSTHAPARGSEQADLPSTFAESASQLKAG